MAGKNSIDDKWNRIVGRAFFPLWKIDLVAPQYPEGLILLIYPNKLSGNVDIINGLNHYIGMKTLHTADFFEFTILPWIIIGFSLLFFVVSFVGKRKWLYGLFFLFVVFGVLAMYDFWQWEYNYGHHLNPDAAIIVPGMAYQPPLIGFKQLLNFGAYSFPDIGGWIFISAGLLLLIGVIVEWKKARHIRKNSAHILILLLALSMSSCNSKPTPIQIGHDQCNACKMTISDEKFGAAILTKKGKTYCFDDIHCMQSFQKANSVDPISVKDYYFTNYCTPHQFVQMSEAIVLSGEMLQSPMNGHAIAFDNMDSAKSIKNYFKLK
jgi:copper chaperone NosL